MGDPRPKIRATISRNAYDHEPRMHTTTSPECTRPTSVGKPVPKSKNNDSVREVCLFFFAPARCFLSGGGRVRCAFLDHFHCRVVVMYVTVSIVTSVQNKDICISQMVPALFPKWGQLYFQNEASFISKMKPLFSCAFELLDSLAFS